MSVLEAVNGVLARAQALFVDHAPKLAGVDLTKLAELKKQVRALLPPLILAAEETGADNATKRLAVVKAVEAWYDREVLPRNAPGPDAIVDPMLRAGCVACANELVDFGVEVIKAYEALKKAA